MKLISSSSCSHLLQQTKRTPLRAVSSPAPCRGSTRVWRPQKTLVPGEWVLAQVRLYPEPFLTWASCPAEPVPPVAVIVPAHVTAGATPGVESVHGGVVPSTWQCKRGDISRTFYQPWRLSERSWNLRMKSPFLQVSQGPLKLPQGA